MVPIIIILAVVLIIAFWCIRTVNDFKKKEIRVQEGLRRKFLGELRWFTDMIDTLRVEDTLYKKETNI
ncbi:MAG: hypothetical protein SOT64_00615 [Candidatus Faecousia sp.]|nr:hypothetical protein [Candidatus Faecousia sp.]